MDWYPTYSTYYLAKLELLCTTILQLKPVSSVVEHSFCIPKDPSSSLQWARIFFFNFKLIQGSNPGQKCHFSSGLQRSSHIYQRLFRAILNTPRGVGSNAELRKQGKIAKNTTIYMLKRKNFDYLDNLLFKIQKYNFNGLSTSPGTLYNLQKFARIFFIYW